MEANEYIFGIRAVMEAVEAGKEIDKVLVKKDLQGDLSKELFAMLKNNGIRSMIAPDTLSSVFPLPDSNVGEVTVAVAEADLERARELIAKE